MGRRVAPLFLLLTGCGMVSGLDSLSTGDLPDAGSSASDGGSDAPPACVATENDCTDGVDNDCNGKTDCEDPACASGGYACTQPLANDAALAWFASSVAPCPGTSQPTDVVTQFDAPATCSCSCTAPKCPSSVSVSFEENTQCTQVNNTQSLVTDGACHPLSFDVQVAAKSSLAGSCTTTSAVTPLSTTKGRVCKTQLAKGGGGCGAGLACLPVKSPAQFATCAIVPNGQSCPAGWPVQTIVGTGVTDSRSCSACTCSTTGGCSGTASFYGGGSCTGVLAAKVDLGSCSQSGSAPTTVGSYKATVSSNATCSTQPTTATGSAVLSGQMTLCCAQ